MKILEIIFLILTFLIPGFFILLALSSLSLFKRKRKYRNKLIILIVIPLIFNGSIYCLLHKINENSSKDKADSEIKEPMNRDELDENTEADEEIEDEKENDTEVEKPVSEKEPDKNTINYEKTSKGYKIETIDGVTYVDGYLIANKTYPLPESFVPTGTHKKASSTGICEECIYEEAYQKYLEMKKEASANNLSIWIASGYRSYSYQGALYNNYVKNRGKEAADTFSARPGHSEHQSGLAFDLNSVTDAFASTKEGIWVNENCYKYGFIIRYPKNKDDETGYKYESWHLRYVGTDLASKLYNNGEWITMESYFGITSKYTD